jgi:hypothetical protein
MPRQNRRREPEPPSSIAGGSGEHVQWRGEDYLVRRIAGANAVKAYRCPGCDHEVQPGVPHVVVWPAEAPDAADRRHWHTPCWDARDRRAPGVQRSRNAPRY